MELKNCFNGVYAGKTVLVTGHTGFKGSWLSFWLNELGVKVIGYSKDIPTNPSHFSLLDLQLTSIEGDICDEGKLLSVFETYKPDAVFHLAAQALVKQSYNEPLETFKTNIIGTATLMEVIRKSSTKAFVNVTSDKAYENKEWVWGYRETDPMGGNDPYSASKGCVELLHASYQKSYFSKNENLFAASARAGNVIGGGDWASDRIIPDLVSSAQNGNKVEIRNPNAIRPWQHVLEPLSGYLLLGQLLLERKQAAIGSWNFGPMDENSIDVKTLAEISKGSWPNISFNCLDTHSGPLEAQLLRLDCSKSKLNLEWKPIWDFNETINRTISWYKLHSENNSAIALTKKDLTDYVNTAYQKEISWTLN